VVEASAGRAPVWVGCTHNSTREAVERAQAAAAIPGVSAILTANPYYNKPSQDGQYQHFRAIAEAVALPVVLYNIPSRSGVNLEPATVARLAADCANICGIKESSGNLAQITELITLVPREFAVYSGDDMLALAVLGVGGAGLVSVASNEIPAEMAQMVRAALTGDWPTARRLNRHWFPLMQANFWEPSPAPVKAVLAMQGRVHETFRLPLVPVTQATRERLRALVGKLGLPVAAREQG
jgi:4-hydroxy-tetrahydrodipicolinate synthase